MESNASHRSLRPALLVGGVLVAVGVVAVASGGSTSAGEGAGGGGWHPVGALLSLAFTFYLVLLVCGALFVLYLLLILRGLREQPSGRMTPLNMLAYLVIVLAILAVLRRPIGLAESEGIEDVLPPQRTGTLPAVTTGEARSEPEGFVWFPSLVFGGLLVIGVLVVSWANARRRRALSPRERTPLAEALADTIEATLDDLRAEQDPRRAVIAAYARLERVLGAHGISRRPSDAPLEYLHRVLHDLPVGPEAVMRLTQLFAWAKFSAHEVEEGMKEEAIAALQALQDELRAAEALAQEERAKALDSLRARAAG